MNKYLVAIVLLVASSAFSQDAWHDENGNAVPDTDARKVVEGFGGWLLVTSDVDWQQKWETPSNAVPRFTEANSIARGNPIFVLTFFSNPQLSASGEADVTCDIDVTRPDGTSSAHQVDATCFRGTLKPDRRHVYLAAPIIGFIGEPNDPAGQWVVRVTLKDTVRHVVVPLKTSFVLLAK